MSLFKATHPRSWIQMSTMTHRKTKRAKVCCEFKVKLVLFVGQFSFPKEWRSKGCRVVFLRVLLTALLTPLLVLTRRTLSQVRHNHIDWLSLERDVDDGKEVNDKTSLRHAGEKRWEWRKGGCGVSWEPPKTGAERAFHKGHRNHKSTFKSKHRQASSKRPMPVSHKGKAPECECAMGLPGETFTNDTALFLRS